MPALAIKFLAASIVSAGGAAGGWAIYKETCPVTIDQLTRKEGFAILTSTNEYKAIFYDQKKKIKEVDELKSLSEAKNAAEKIKSWCQTQSKFLISEHKESPHFISLCTSSGINSVRGQLTYSFPSIQWIDEEKNEQEKLYQTILTVYKYNSEFLTWINEDQKDKITSTSDKSKYTVLKDKCTKGLSLNYKDVKQNLKYYKWWCKSLPYKTVQEKLEHTVSNWQLKSDWKGISGLWNTLEDARKAVKPGDDGSSHPTDDEYRDWCNKQMKMEIIGDHIYQETYLLAKSICASYKH